jgi:hypothetical protein
MITRRTAITERKHLDQSPVAGAMTVFTDLVTDALTHVELTWQAKRIEHRIRFGHPVANSRLDCHRRQDSRCSAAAVWQRWSRRGSQPRTTQQGCNRRGVSRRDSPPFEPRLVAGERVGARGGVHAETVMDVMPMLGRGVGGIDSERLDAVDRLATHARPSAIP